jgi:hypothetical protein
MNEIATDQGLGASSRRGLRRLRRHWLIAPVAAALYPLTLIGFHQSVAAAKAGGGVAQALAAAVCLLLSVAMPVVALAIFTALMRIAAPTRAELLARRAALFSVTAPPLFVLTGVMCFVAGVPQADVWILAVFWLGLAAAILLADRSQPVPPPREGVSARLRMAHGVVALVFIVGFLGLHLANHMSALVDVATHAWIMDTLRQYYRATLVEPLLLLCVVFLVGTGGVLAWRWSARPGDAFRAFQLASGVYLAVAITSHAQAVFWFARIHMKIPTDWGFAIGAPAGLIVDPWNIRLLPYYFLAVVCAIGHPFAGARIVALQHGGPRRWADAMVLWGLAFAVLVSTLISLAMSGLRLNFSGA